MTFDCGTKKGSKQHESLSLRQIHKRTPEGRQVPLVTSRRDLAATEVCWRLSGRWRQENYLKYARAHFALDGLDSYADLADDPDRMVPNPAKKQAKTAVTTAKHALADAETEFTAAVDNAAERARRPATGGTAEVGRGATDALATAHTHLDQAKAASRATPARVALRDIRPHARLLNEERKLITHAIRMAASPKPPSPACWHEPSRVAGARA